MNFRKEAAEFDRQQTDFNKFGQIVRKYVGITELTPTIVNEFIKKIIVHAPYKLSGYRLFLILLVNLYLKRSLSPIKESSAGISLILWNITSLLLDDIFTHNVRIFLMLNTKFCEQ